MAERSALAKVVGTAHGSADFAQQRAGIVAICPQAVIQLVILAFDTDGRPLGVGLDEIAIAQFDMAAELGRHAQPEVVVITLGTLAITEGHLGGVVKPVEFDDTVEVIPARGIQPRAVKPQVIAFHVGRSPAIKVQVRTAMARHDPDQPLPITHRQRGIGTDGEPLLDLLIAAAAVSIH